MRVAQTRRARVPTGDGVAELAVLDQVDVAGAGMLLAGVHLLLEPVGRLHHQPVGEDHHAQRHVLEDGVPKGGGVTGKADGGGGCGD